MGGDIIVEAVEHDQKHATARRKTQYAVRAETVGLQEAILEGPHFSDILVVCPIKWGQVEIRRRKIDVPVCGGCLEDVMDDDSGEIEQHAGDALWVWFELVATRHCPQLSN
jgi:hypothetical protein